MRTIVKDFAPFGENARNSEGSFITLNNGDILFVYSRYCTKSDHDNAPADLYGVISKDEGVTFGESFPIVKCNEVENASNLMSTSLLRLNNGDIGLFFLRKSEHSTIKGLFNCQPCLVRSSDEGKTWKDFQVIEEEELYLVLNNDRVIKLDDGTIVFIVARHDAYKKDDSKFGAYELLSAYDVVYVSEDDGRTWKKQGVIDKIYTFGSGLQEPGVIQKQDGSLYCFIRTDLGCQLESFSTDKGKTWSTPRPSRFTAPISPMTMKRLNNGDIMAVWNPVPLYNGRSQMVDGVWTGGRNPLVYAISKDDGKTWSNHKEIENDERSGFCYIALHEIENAILLGYCAGSVEDGGCLNRLRISRILKSEL